MEQTVHFTFTTNFFILLPTVWDYLPYKFVLLEVNICVHSINFLFSFLCAVLFLLSLLFSCVLLFHLVHNYSLKSLDFIFQFFRQSRLKTTTASLREHSSRRSLPE